MGAVTYRLRAELRRSWRGALGVALLVALLGGVGVAAAAGARRTTTAYPRMLEETNAAELLVSPAGEQGEDPTPFYDEVAALPEVRALGVVAGMPILPMAGTPTADLAAELATEESLDLGLPTAIVDGRAVFDIARPRILDGRLPDPEQADEALVSWQLARSSGLEPGDVLDLVVVPNDLVESEESAQPDQGTPLQVTVTGVGVFANEVVPFSDLEELGTLWFTPPVATMAPRAEWAYEAAVVDLVPGADPAAVGDRIEEIGAEAAGTGGVAFVSDQTASAAEVQDSLRPLAVALTAFAVVVAVIGLFVIGHAVTRHTRVAPSEAAALSALGAGRWQRGAVPLIRAAVIGVIGAIGAVVLAILLSPRFPNGPARVAEPDPGLRADAPVLIVGALVIVVATVIGVVPAAILRTRPPRALRRAASAVSGQAARAGMPAPAVQGVRFAFDAGEGPTTTPVRSTLVAVIVAVAAVLAAATFATSLAGLVDTPERYGQGWDRMVDGQFSTVPARFLVDLVADRPDVRGVAAGAYTEVVVDGERMPAVTMLTVAGDTGVTVVEGARADGPGEIALGGEVLGEIGAGVGDRVTVDGGGGPETMTVVGEVVFPRFNQGSFGQTGLGFGAQLHPDALPPLEQAEEDGPVHPLFDLDGRLHQFVAIDLDGDPAALDDELGAQMREQGFFAFLRTDLPPTTISDLDRVRSVPLALAAVLALAAAAVLAHLLGSAVRERRRELALLTTLGFTRRQLRWTVGWHATVVAAVACVVGIPIGVAVGRLLWEAFASEIHAVSAAAVPWWWVALALPVALLLANTVAAVPGRWAARTRPATALHRE